jgi:hypothetical protein
MPGWQRWLAGLEAGGTGLLAGWCWFGSLGRALYRREVEGSGHPCGSWTKRSRPAWLICWRRLHRQGRWDGVFVVFGSVNLVLVRLWARAVRSGVLSSVAGPVVRLHV